MKIFFISYMVCNFFRSKDVPFTSFETKMKWNDDRILFSVLPWVWDVKDVAVEYLAHSRKWCMYTVKFKINATSSWFFCISINLNTKLIQIVINSYPKENCEHEESGSNASLNYVAECLVTVASYVFQNVCVSGMAGSISF